MKPVYKHKPARMSVRPGTSLAAQTEKAEGGDVSFDDLDSADIVPPPPFPEAPGFEEFWAYAEKSEGFHYIMGKKKLSHECKNSVHYNPYHDELVSPRSPGARKPLTPEQKMVGHRTSLMFVTSVSRCVFFDSF